MSTQISTQTNLPYLNIHYPDVTVKIVKHASEHSKISETAFQKIVPPPSSSKPIQSWGPITPVKPTIGTTEIPSEAPAFTVGSIPRPLSASMLSRTPSSVRAQTPYPSTISQTVTKTLKPLMNPNPLKPNRIAFQKIVPPRSSSIPIHSSGTITPVKPTIGTTQISSEAPAFSVSSIPRSPSVSGFSCTPSYVRTQKPYPSTISQTDSPTSSPETHPQSLKSISLEYSKTSTLPTTLLPTALSPTDPGSFRPLSQSSFVTSKSESSVGHKRRIQSPVIQQENINPQLSFLASKSHQDPSIEKMQKIFGRFNQNETVSTEDQEILEQEDGIYKKSPKYQAQFLFDEELEGLDLQTGASIEEQGIDKN